MWGLVPLVNHDVLGNRGKIKTIHKTTPHKMGVILIGKKRG